MATNPYPGVNAHLNSALLQPDGGWESFHAAHIQHLGQAIEAALPDNYYVLTEKSLQVTSLPLDEESGVSRRSTEPDIGVFQRSTSTAPVLAGGGAAATLHLPLRDTLMELDTDQWVPSVAVYRLEGRVMPGELVTRVELLSPANKPGRNHYGEYIAQRQRTLANGVYLVEIDYLHNTRPIVKGVPSYRDRHPDAFPYIVLVSSPYPSLAEGGVVGYGAKVDEPLPRVPVPLAEDETAVLDLQVAYNATFASMRAWALLTDYSQPPHNFHRYTEPDQARIRELMAAFPA